MARRRGRRWTGALALAAVAVTALGTGCGGSGDDGADEAAGDRVDEVTTEAAEPDGPDQPTTTEAAEPDDTEGDGGATGGDVTVAEVEAALLAGDRTMLAVDETAGPAEARCLAEGWVRDLTPAELAEMGLPETAEEINGLLYDVDATQRLFASVFDCLDMRPFLAEQLDHLPAEQARCVAEAVVDDEVVRLLFLIGTRSGADPGGPWAWLSEHTDELDAHTRACA